MAFSNLPAMTTDNRGGRKAFSFDICGSDQRQLRNQHQQLILSDSTRPPTIRGDSECALDAPHQHLQQQHQQVDKQTSSRCGSSCADELGRLEFRLAAMESRLSDFEAILRSCRSASGDSGSLCWPESTATGAGVGGSGMEEPLQSLQSPQQPPSPATPPPPIVRSRDAFELFEPPTDSVPAVVETSLAHGTALNLIFTDEDSSSSSTWTDLGSKATKPNDNQVPQQQVQVQEQKQVQIQEQEQEQGLVKDHGLEQDPEQEPEQEHGLEKEESISSADSFELVRYSTQETFVHQQQHDLATYSTVNTTSSSQQHQKQQKQQKKQQLMIANNSMLTTALSRAEQLVTPAGERGSCGLLEPGVQRELAQPPASVNVTSDWANQTVCRPLPSTHPTGKCSEVLLEKQHLSSCETATADCAVDMIVKSRVSRVRHVCDVDDVAEATAVVADVVRRGPPAVSDAATVATASTGATTASVSADDGRTKAVFTADCRPPNSCADCRLCGDLIPYARKRLSDLERDGALGRRSSKDVCIQRTGFSKLDTVLIAGLALKATSLFESEGDQANFVRLTLRKMGFECAVVIGRHFTGCICGFDSSRLLLDIGDRSCLIFSFFQLTSDLNQLSIAK